MEVFPHCEYEDHVLISNNFADLHMLIGVLVGSVLLHQNFRNDKTQL